MSISYHVYANDGQGGLVNYASPIATTTATTFTISSLASPSDNTFAVRAFDTVSGIEEANTDASVRIILDASGNDVTARPNSVIGLAAYPTSGGTCWVSWGYDEAGQGGPPLAFLATLTPVAPTTGTAASTTVSYVAGIPGYGCVLSGLVAGGSYQIAVQSQGSASVLGSGVATVALSYPAGGLSDVDALSASAIP
jgi:hypothetical protein